MRYSKTGWYAVFESAEQPHGWDEREVEAFSGAREALVVDSRLGRLVPACRQPGFLELRPCERVTSVVSCQPGWWVCGPDRREAVVAWLISHDGKGVPLVPSRGEGVAWPAAPTATLVGPEPPGEDGGADAGVRMPNGRGTRYGPESPAPIG
ncbi:hypothetical protein [Gandjariella thermophila]|uniref:Uncharacterized protein n=1 Tax=Gandjariella thermophila TaxID=1931992 RepID=A0A4D4J2L3_9PSEU|nr:hypothetical protein [Gandjariella thermophila]GDY29028.1 hypothetical protein GTS_06610 [Gandjariella thermophila]